jgi:hypothetical protein
MVYLKTKVTKCTNVPIQLKGSGNMLTILRTYSARGRALILPKTRSINKETPQLQPQRKPQRNNPYVVSPGASIRNLSLRRSRIEGGTLQMGGFFPLV